MSIVWKPATKHNWNNEKWYFQMVHLIILPNWMISYNRNLPFDNQYIITEIIKYCYRQGIIFAKYHSNVKLDFPLIFLMTLQKHTKADNKTSFLFYAFIFSMIRHYITVTIILRIIRSKLIIMIVADRFWKDRKWNKELTTACTMQVHTQQIIIVKNTAKRISNKDL